MSNKGARFLLDKVRGNVEGHVDVQILNYMKEMNLYAFHPNLAFQDVSTNVSSNLAGRFPMLMNKPLSYIRDGSNMGLDYKFSINMYQVCGVPINVYTLVFLVFGIVTGMSGRIHEIMKVMGLFYLVEFGFNPSLLTLKMIIYAQLMFSIGVGASLALGFAGK